jgi:hypothetical protein
MRDWSFVEKNECNDQGTRVDPILLVLFNKLVSTKRYINVVSNMSLDDFLTSRYDVTPKRKITGKRYLEFFWNDLCGYQIELHFDINEATDDVVRDLYVDIQMKNRKFTSMLKPQDDYVPESKLLASI